MMRYKVCQYIFLFIFLVIIFGGCNKKNIENSKESIISVPTQTTTPCNKKKIKNSRESCANEEKVTNAYFPEIEMRQYKGDFTFTDERNTKSVCVRCNCLGGSKIGELYEIKFDSVQEAEIPDQLLNLGFFWVRERNIVRFAKLSEKQKKKLLSDDILPKNANIVCQMQPEMKKRKDGVREEITTFDDLIEYCYSDTSTATNFYETIIWKKNVGIILYRRGYAAELDAITLWLEDYVEKPHEFAVKKR